MLKATAIAAADGLPPAPSKGIKENTAPVTSLRVRTRSGERQGCARLLPGADAAAGVRGRARREVGSETSFAVGMEPRHFLPRREEKPRVGQSSGKPPPGPFVGVLLSESAGWGWGPDRSVSAWERLGMEGRAREAAEGFVSESCCGKQADNPQRWLAALSPRPGKHAAGMAVSLAKGPGSSPAHVDGRFQTALKIHS